MSSYTATIIPCEKGHESTVLVLLENKADLNLQDKVSSRRMMIMIEDGDDNDNNCGDDDRWCWKMMFIDDFYCWW